MVGKKRGVAFGFPHPPLRARGVCLQVRPRTHVIAIYCARRVRTMPVPMWPVLRDDSAH